MPKTVLLADDSLTIQRVVTLTFANEDVTITSVSDGDQAVESIARKRPDLVLADIAMPGRSGYQVVEFVRSQPELSSLPVLLLAGAFDHVDESHVRTSGADGVLTKPFEPKALIGHVKQLLETGRPELLPYVDQTTARQPVAEIGPSPLDALAVTAPIADVQRPIDVAAIEAIEMPSVEIQPIEVPTVEHPASVTSAFESLSRSVVDAPVADVATSPSPEVVAVSTESAAAPTEPEPPVQVIAPLLEAPAPVAVPPMPRMPGPDYFEQIDQAFAALAKAPRPSLNLVPKAPTPAPQVEESRDDVVAAVLEPRLVPLANAMKAAEAPTRTIPLSDAFNALLDAERAGVVDTSIRLSGVPALSPVDVDALTNEVMRRVLEQMSDRVVRETVTEIVTSTAERLVREEIEQVKRNIT